MRPLRDEVDELTTAVRWYEVVLSRPADRIVADGCVEWDLTPRSKIQVRQAADRDARGRGPVDVVLEVLDVESIEDALRRDGIEVQSTTSPSFQFRLVTVTDADGNRLTFGQDLGDPSAAPKGDAPGW